MKMDEVDFSLRVAYGVPWLLFFFGGMGFFVLLILPNIEAVYV